jgi:hypothetical protein
MSTSKGADPSGSPDDEAVNTGFGGPLRGQDGSAPSKETQRETGGSGGSALTRNEVTESGEPHASAGRAHQPAHTAPTDWSGKKGFQDTRGEQAGASETGLGAPETGANQTPEDLEHKP